MEFTAETSPFAESLEQIQGAVEKRNTIPILSHCLITAEAQGLRLAATDLEVGVRLFCPARVNAQGAGALPARRLLEILRSLPDSDVRLRALEHQWVQITSGRSTFKLAAMPKENFPSMPDVPQPVASIPAGILAGLIERTAFAVPQEEGRSVVKAALLVLKPDRVEMVATDGFRLPLAARDIEPDGLKAEEWLLIPKRSLALLGRLADAYEDGMSVAIAKDNSHLFFTAGDSVLITRMIAGEFAKYEAVLPQSNGLHVAVDAESFRGALERVSLLASEHHHGVSVAFEAGRITLSTTGGDTGEATETVDASYAGETLRIGFNCVFLKDFFDVVKRGQVEIALKDGQSAAEFRPAEIDPFRYRYVVMPMRA